MSGTHADSERPMTQRRDGRTIDHPNDDAALNGGSQTFMFRDGMDERRPPAKGRLRVIVAVCLFGGLALGLALMAGLA
jgi:hypothetical protein